MSGTENLTTMFTDIVGFTAKTARMSRERHRAMLADHDRVLLPVVRKFGGRRVKSVGDGMLLVFRSPTDAVKCAMAIHDALYLYNRGRTGDDTIQVRAALNSGEVQVERGDIFGESVNVAARLEGVTPAGEVYLTQSVHLAMNRAEVPCEPVGTETFKGVDEPVEIYRVPRRGEGAPFGTLPQPQHGEHESAADPARASRGFRPALWVGALLAAVVGVVAVLGYLGYRDASEDETMLRQEALDALEENDISTATALAEVHIKANPDDANALLLMGHVQMAGDKVADGVDSYRRALETDPTLAVDPVLIENLLGAVTRVETIGPLVEDYPVPALIDGLAELTARGTRPQSDAATALLERLGRDDRVDRLSRVLAELDGAEECEDRLALIRRLRELGDRRALPRLRELEQASVVDKVRYLCYRVELRDTIAMLSGESVPPDDGNRLGRLLDRIKTAAEQPPPDVSGDNADRK